MDGWAQVLNGRPMIFTEYGADTMPSEHKLPSVMWSQEYQNEYLDMNHNVFDSYDFVQGELVWNFADFQTTEGIMRANGNKKGIFTPSPTRAHPFAVCPRSWILLEISNSKWEIRAIPKGALHAKSI